MRLPCAGGSIAADRFWLVCCARHCCMHAFRYAAVYPLLSSGFWFLVSSGLPFQKIRKCTIQQKAFQDAEHPFLLAPSCCASGTSASDFLLWSASLCLGSAASTWDERMPSSNRLLDMFQAEVCRGQQSNADDRSVDDTSTRVDTAVYIFPRNKALTTTSGNIRIIVNLIVILHVLTFSDTEV